MAENKKSAFDSSQVPWMDPDSKSGVSIFDIPWQEVLCRHVLSHLNLPTLFSLRLVSQQFCRLIDLHFSLVFTINTTTYADCFSSAAFTVLTSRNSFLKKMILCNSKDWLSDVSLLPVIQNNPLLDTIDLANCLSISNASLYTIGAHCHKLRWLSLRGCVWVTSDGMLPLITNQQPLEYVDLTGCWNLDDEAIIQLVQYCNGIRYLMLNNIYGLTDRSVLSVAHLCPHLWQLSVQGCWRLTDHSIQMLGELCPELRAIQVQECRNITEISLAPLRARKVRIDKPPPLTSEMLRLEYRENLRRLNLQI